jgi:phytoene synthase
VHPLLAPAEIDLATAVRRCEAHLRARRAGLLLSLRVLPEHERSDLAALAAWDLCLREVAEGEDGEFDARRGFQEARRELRAAYEGEPRSAVGRGLSATARRHDLPVEELALQLEALDRARGIASWTTRDELLRHAHELAAPRARLPLLVLGLSGEKRALLGEALAVGVQLATWTADLARLRELGHVYLPVEDLARCGAALASLGAARADEPLRRAVAGQIVWAREWLAKGWPLCTELGHVRGRALAFWLRWHAASLSALEARDCDPLPGSPPAGWMRALACGTAALASRGAPRLA